MQFGVNYNCMSEKLYFNQFLIFLGKVDSNLLNDITNILDDDCISTPEPSPSSSLESFYEFPESETTDATTLKTIYGGWGDQNTDNETKTKQDVKDVEVVVHEAIMPSSPMICSVKAIRSLIKDSIHNFIEDLQNMDVKYKWQFQEDYFISKSSESMKNEPGTIFPSPELKISKSDKFFCLNDVFIRLVAERNFEKYEDTDSEEECGREIEVLKSGLIYLHSDQYSDCENI